MSATSIKYENGIQKMSNGANGTYNFDLLSYGAGKTKTQMSPYVVNPQQYPSTVDQSSQNTRNNLNNKSPAENARGFALDSTMGAVGVYLDKNDKALVKVLTPYGSDIAAARITYGDGVAKALQGGQYVSIYGPEAGNIAKANVKLTAGLALAGAAIETYHSNTPLNEAGKQAWGVGGGLLTSELAVGVFPEMAALGPIGWATVGMAGALSYTLGNAAFKNLYDNVLPGLLQQAANGAWTAAQLADQAYNSAASYVDNLWNSTGAAAAAAFDALKQGVSDFGDDLGQLAKDYGWADPLNIPDALAGWLPAELVPWAGAFSAGSGGGGGCPERSRFCLFRPR